MARQLFGGTAAVRGDDAGECEDQPGETIPFVSPAGRNAYYRDSWRRAWQLIPALTIALLISLGLNVAQYTMHETPLPIAVDQTGRVFSVTPLDESVMDGDGIRQWAARTIPRLYNMDFRNYREQMASLEPVFTGAGYKGYLDAVARFDLIETVKQNNYIVGAAPRSAPQVVAEGVLEGRRYWKVRAPILVTFDNGTSPLTQNLMVTAYVVRVPETDNPFGLSIHSFAAKRG